MDEPDLLQIQDELQQIINNAIGEKLRTIPDDVPILDLGISSLELVDGMRLVYDQFGVLVSIRRVIEGQVTLRGLALYIEQELNSRQSQKKKAQTGPAKWKSLREIPLAPSQQHVGFLSRYSSEAGAAFNESVAVRLSGVLDGPALQAAIEEVGSRYEALRTSLNPDADSLIVGSGEPLELAVSRAPAERLDQRLSEIVTRPFKAGSRLFRVELLRINESDHLLILVGNLLVLEQQSLVTILEDIAQLYRAFTQDKDAGAPPATLQWSDYLALGETAEARAARLRAEAYWKRLFTSGVPRVDLPGDHPRPPEKKYSGARLRMELDPVLDQHLRQWASQEAVDLSTVLFASFALYLHRLSGQKDLVVGVESKPFYADTGIQMVARTRNMLPVWSEFDTQLSFREHIRKLAAVLEGAQEHRQLSLAELIRLLDLPRDQSRSALFTTAFRSLQRDPAPDFKALHSSYVLPPTSGGRYDLELIVQFEETGMSLICDYSTELFEASTVKRWLRGMQVLMRAGIEDPNQKCGMLSVLPADERYWIEVEWNNTAKAFPKEKTTLDVIMEQVQNHPDNQAIRFKGEALSYRQLSQRIDHFARILVRQGVSHGDRVGILLKRSLDLVPAMLATWRVGALYVPMDINFPRQRLEYMVADASVQVVLTNREFYTLVDAAQGMRIVCIEEEGAVAGVRLETVSPAVGSGSAMILFTSGSTGKPKGVEIRHSSLLNLLLATRDILEFRSTSRMLALTTISFDVSENELFMPLMAGGCVDVGEDGLVADGGELAERIASQKPSHIQATPSTFRSLLNGGWQGDPDIYLLSMGEALDRDLAEQLLGKCRALWNLYGPTETTVYSATYQVVSLPGQAMRIGRPLPNTQFYILDQQLQAVPLGAVGEVYIGGEGPAIGYWQRPELTGERFIPSPFDPTQRIYRTGDLGYYLPDGNIVCLGRVDDQVKIHGVRIELGEVEIALRELARVQDAVVVPWKDPQGDTHLVAHIIPRTQDGVSASELRASLRERLPETMIPLYFLFLEAFPLTANGKVHRASLPPPGKNGRKASGIEIEPPATPTEQALARIWAGVLGIDVAVIGRDSEFMDLGGHSLLMTQLMVEVRRLFQISFSMREFFGAPTIRKFGKLIDDRKREETGKTNSIRQSNSKRSAEWARQRMAFLQREAQLPLYIAPARGLTYKPPAEISNVLLTGATGFLGAYIVAEILNTTQADLYCLVRPRRGENSKERIERQMRKYAVWGESETWQFAWNRRLHVVDGDVTLPRLGIADAEYESLAMKVDTIFHGAAHVNFIYPYEALRATNVLGIHEMIQFAFYQRIKPIHHLSTAAIWPMGAQNTFYEKDPIDHKGILNLGYDEAKWVGEKCLLNAAERGLPVARYRPGEVGGDSITGHCVTDHFLVASIKGFLQFGAFPQLDIKVDVAPVDYVAQAMVYLAFRRNPLGRAFHLTNPHRRSMGEALAFLHNCGYQFEELPFEELRDRLVSSRDFASNALFAYQAALEDMDNISMQLPTYDTRETLRELKGSGISCAPADEKLFGTYLRYLQETGFIPQPEMILDRV
jgi:myxalamid-type nonribosomal peptide synthetase MxaA